MTSHGGPVGPGLADPGPVAAAEDVTIRELGTQDLDPVTLRAIRSLMDVAFGDDEEERFTEDDWQHAIGGRHFVLEADGTLLGHASVVERSLHVDGRPMRTGYVEAVAIEPSAQGRGLGSRLMEAVDAHIAASFELGALGTGRHRFYERLGWRTWRGRAFVRTPEGDRRTPDEEGYILVLETPTTPIRPLDLGAALSCDWRPGDVW
jgi:aminoglycoside 2'-N-acetyltransferase I